jgi:hypothetical protein
MKHPLSISESNITSLNFFESITWIFSRVHRDDHEEIFLDHDTHLSKNISEKDAEAVARNVPFWIEQTYSRLELILFSNDAKERLSSIGIKDFTSAVDSKHRERPCPDEDDLLQNLVTTHLNSNAKIQVLSLLLLWSYLSKNTLQYITRLFQAGLVKQLKAKTVLHAKHEQGNPSIDHIWSWLSSFTKCVSMHSIALFTWNMHEEGLCANLCQFQIFFIEDVMSTTLACFMWIGVNPVGTVKELARLDDVSVPNTVYGNLFRQNKVLLLSATYLSYLHSKCKHFSCLPAEFSFCGEGKNKMLERSMAVGKKKNGSIFTTIGMLPFIARLAVIKHDFSLHESILSELSYLDKQSMAKPVEAIPIPPPKGPSEIVSDRSDIDKQSMAKSDQTPVEAIPTPPSKGPSEIESILKTRSGTMLELFSKYQSLKSDTFTHTKEFYSEMSFLSQIMKKDTKSCDTFEKSLKVFVDEKITHPPTHPMRSIIIGFVYLLITKLITEPLEEESPFLPAYATLFKLLHIFSDTRKSQIRKNKWEFICEIFWPDGEKGDANEPLRLYILKCVSTLEIFPPGPGLFNFFQQYFLEDTTDHQTPKKRTTKNNEIILQGPQIKKSTTAQTLLSFTQPKFVLQGPPIRTSPRKNLSVTNTGSGKTPKKTQVSKRKAAEPNHLSDQKNIPRNQKKRK